MLQLQSAFGIVALLAIAWALGENRRAVSLKQAAIMPVAHAAGTTQVIVSGWANSGGVVKPLDVSPLPVHSQ